jgi:hypothetical protein
MMKDDTASAFFPLTLSLTLRPENLRTLSTFYFAEILKSKLKVRNSRLLFHFHGQN